jgi:hypothetical protein
MTDAPKHADHPIPAEMTLPPRQRRRSIKRLIGIVASVLLVYAAVAYLLMPFLWTRYVRRHPSLTDLPGITLTSNGVPGDPLNVALIGTEDDLVAIMLAAKWYPADALSLRSCLRIAKASVFTRPYDEAPVSSLYLFGRKQDLAFQQPVGDSPRHRHHVRFWVTEKLDPDGRPVWIGSAIYDERVGLSRRTGQITHLTAADVDTERDYLFKDLQQTGDLIEFFTVNGFHKQLKGRNGGGDPWHTDGKLYAGVIKHGNSNQIDTNNKD